MLGGSVGSVGGSWVSGREGRRSGLGTVGVGCRWRIVGRVCRCPWLGSKVEQTGGDEEGKR